MTSRRAFLRTGALLAGAGALAGCATGSDGPERPAGYEPLGRLAVADAAEAVVGDAGTTVYLAATDGFAVADVSDPGAPELLAERSGLLADREGGPLREILDVAVEGDRLLVAGPANARADAVEAAVVYDVADPADPRELAVYETGFPIHNADLDGGLAYLTGSDGDRNPLVVVDPEAGTEVGRWSVLDANSAWGDVPPGLRPVHDVTVTDGRAAVAYWDAGTWLLDVSDPAVPSPVGSVVEQELAELAALDAGARSAAGLELPGNSHYALEAPGGELLVVGREAWDGDGDGEGAPGGIDLYDVSDPAVPERVASIAPPETPDSSMDGPWTTAHNVGFRDGRLYASWYHGGVTIHDVADPADPRELAAWRDPARAAFWTAVPARDCFVASSTPYPGDTEGALYTFPDEPGRQTDPPPLADAGE